MTGRVLQVVGPSTGGIRRHVEALVGHLRDAGWDVVVAAPAGVLADAEHVLPIPAGLSPLGLRSARRALRPLLEDADVVHAHGLKPGWLTTSLRPRPPVVCSVHNLVLDEAAGRAAPALRALEARLPARVEATIAISGEVARRFAGLPGAERIHVVPPVGPVPAPGRSAEQVRADLGVGPDTDLVVTPARLHPQKDLHLLLDVADAVRARRPGLRWFVFGEGGQRAELEAEIARRDLGTTVHLAGRRPDVDDELAAADVVAITSRWESGPLVVLEALALGRPVVSTAVGLVPDVVGPAEGAVVPVGDPGAFASALVEVLERGDRGAGDLGAAPAAVQGSSLHPEALADAVAAVYREVLPSR